MTLTRARTIQYIGILCSLGIIAVGYWYFGVRAGVKTNSSALQSQGVGDLSAGLAGYWKLDDASGTTATDASTNGNNGTLTNGPTWTTGQIGGAADFDGSNDYITTSASATVDLDTRHSVSAWFNPDTLPTDGTYKQIVAEGAASCCGLEFGLALSRNGGVNFVQLNHEASGTTLTYETTLSTGTWYHLAGTWDGVTMRLYLNGTQVSSQAQSGTISEFNNIVTIGSGEGVGYFDGKIDEVRIYSRVLSADEISNLYRLTTPTGVDTSLKGYWSFNADALSGTTAYDWSGAGNNGTLTNGPTVGEGRVGQTLDFNGSNQYINVGDVNAIDGVTALTASAWIKTTSAGSVERQIISKTGCTGATNGGVFELAGIGASGDVGFILYKNGGTPDYYVVNSGVPINDGTWHFIVGLYDGSALRIYTDGVLNASTTAVGITTPSTSDPLQIGRCNGGGAGYWLGSLDEARVYNRALSATEIKSLYDRGAPDRGNTSALQPQGTGQLDSGLAAYWKMDDGSGTTATDSSTNAKNGVLQNGTTWGTGQIGGAASFDGTDDTIDVTNTSTSPINIALGDKVSTAFWYKANQSNGTAGVLYRRSGGGCEQHTFNVLGGASTDTLSFYYRGGNCSGIDNVQIAGVSKNVWHHVVSTYDTTTGAFVAYLDGARSTSSTAIPTSDISNSTSTFYMGGTTGQYFNGFVDEFRIYKRVLSADEVVALYRLTLPTGVDTGLKGYWSFNGQDMSGTTAYDRSGTVNNGTLTNGPSITEGVVGQALTFDGSNDYILMSSGSSSAVGNQSNYSLSMWFKHTTTGDNRMYCEEGSGFNPLVMVSAAGASGAIQFFHRDDSGSSVSVDGKKAVNDNNWHLATLTRSGSTFSVYVDGIFENSGTGTVGTFTTATGQQLGGCFTIRNGNYYPGSLDEVRTYNRTLNAAEIKALYDVGASDKRNTSVTQPQGTGRLDSGLAGYWKFDENTGTSAADASTNGNTGTLTNGPTWTTGMIGSGISFDGVNDYIAVPDSASLRTSSHTLSAWVKWTSLPTSGHWADIVGRVAGTGYINYQLVYDNAIARGWTAAMDPDWSNDFVSYPSTPTLGTWYHAVVSYDNVSGKYKLYLNGALVAENTVTATPDLTAGGELRIGDDPSNSPNSVNGVIDEVRVYNRVLSADEVSQLYRLASPTGTDTSLKGYWSFNGQDLSGTTAYDRSGAGSNGTLTNGPSITEGKLGQGLSFDGSNDYVALGDHSSEQTVYTIGFWVYQTGSVSGNPFARGDSGACFYNPRFDMDGTSVTYAESGCSGTGVVGSAPLSVGWHHVAATRNGATSKLYVDGELVPTTGASAGFLGDGSTGKASIGASWQNNTSYGGFLNTKVDEVRVYNRVLSAGEIKTLYNLSK